MRGLRGTLLGWIEERTKDLLETPRAWGSNEAVEMQVLLLLELRALVLQPEREIDNPRRILDTYIAYLNKTYPKKPNRPLFQVVEEDELGHNLGRELRRFLDAVAPALLDEGRITQAVGTTAPPEPVERHGEMRAFDSDRGPIEGPAVTAEDADES